jgi:hypothetical protein
LFTSYTVNLNFLQKHYVVDTSHFVIGENDGVIKVNTGVTLDYSTKNEYKLVVTAKDTNDATAKSASTTVTVKIQTSKFFSCLVF